MTLKVEKEVKELKQKLTGFDKQSFPEISEIPSLSDEELSKIYENLSVPLPARIPKKLSPGGIIDKLALFTPNSRESESNTSRQLSTPELPSAKLIKESLENDIIPLINAPENSNLSIELYNKVLYACALKKDVKSAEFTLQKIKEAGLTPNIFTYEQLINVYSSVGDVKNALSAFDMIETARLEQTVYSFANLIKAYVNNLQIDDAFNVYSKMKAAKIMPNQGCIKNREIARAWKTFDHMRLEVCQPDEVTYSLMIHICAKMRDVERAFDLYQEMTEKGLCPTDVTFNSLIDACARLLEDMSEHGYLPDLYTYNSLVYACAHKGDIYMARKLLLSMMQSARQNPSLTPNLATFSNLFLAYSAYKISDQPIKQLKQENNGPSYNTLSISIVDEVENNNDNDHSITAEEIINSTESLVETNSNNLLSKYKDHLLVIGSDIYPLLSNPPITQKQILIESTILFKYILSIIEPFNSTSLSTTKFSRITPMLFNSYLSVFEKNAYFNRTLELYRSIIPKYNIELNSWIFKTMLKSCYKHKKIEDAWGIWQDWKTWLGMTKEVEYNVYKEMIHILARCDDIWGAIRLLQKLSTTQVPKIEDFQLLRQKTIESEDEFAESKIMELCYFDEGTPKTRVKELLARKWKGVNVLPGQVGRRVLEKKLGIDNRNKWWKKKSVKGSNVKKVVSKKM
ncbi:11693_t:CDS:10 [Dentiscutata erythropus]|uniref:11693_t:CDS:1 n=1 Tax=Dentiscutata erythropus TaxID=1348616 RepID=A0A9N8VYB8_9GLOM|nr:11693_t:CDS:10 [Dentiscutata erythropus]